MKKFLFAFGMLMFLAFSITDKAAASPLKDNKAVEKVAEKETVVSKVSTSKENTNRYIVKCISMPVVYTIRSFTPVGYVRRYEYAYTPTTPYYINISPLAFYARKTYFIRRTKE